MASTGRDFKLTAAGVGQMRRAALYRRRKKLVGQRVTVSYRGRRLRHLPNTFDIQDGRRKAQNQHPLIRRFYQVRDDEPSRT
jgi:hypothetical protein